jgi:rRNA-processing protein FCF1
MTKQNHDIFILNQIYPDAKSIFQCGLKPLDEIKDDCFVVVDTNVLLVPYTVNPKSLEEIHNTYSRLIESKQLVIPGQVAREFAQNRATKVSDLYEALSKKRNNEQFTKLERYPLLESMSEFKDVLELSSEIELSIKKYRDKLGVLLDKIKDWIWDDPISLIYRDLFSTDVVIDLQISDTEKEEIVKDLDYRYKHSIAPGYKDYSKDDKGIGDLLIWRTILKIAHEHKKNVIFISNDNKTDWWHQSGKQALYPRYELVDEFRRASDQQSFHIVTFSRFLELYGASKDVINDVRHKEKVNLNDSYGTLINLFSNNYVRYLNSLSRGEQDREIDQKILDTFKQIIDAEEFAGAMADTNAFNWSIDAYNITDIDISDEVCTVLLTFSASGTQDEDRLFAGNKITGEAEAIIDQSSKVTYQIINVEVEDWCENED